jgi:hypothetical protein
LIDAVERPASEEPSHSHCDVEKYLVVHDKRFDQMGAVGSSAATRFCNQGARAFCFSGGMTFCD